MASMGAAELDIQPGHELGTWEREETCVLARLGGFALIPWLRKPTPFASASPSLKAEVSGWDGRLAAEGRQKAKKNNRKKTTHQLLIILTFDMIIHIY